ncbi:hypothetical protein LJC61_08015 [Ruminococcaceae bacterium OttesenSCG-928-A16]|nr:hypothetical protein [Ruminococcaceae bacterium OttesenSCG-928-A16]
MISSAPRYDHFDTSPYLVHALSWQVPYYDTIIKAICKLFFAYLKTTTRPAKLAAAGS